MLARSQLGAALAEKQAAVNLWGTIETLARRLRALATHTNPNPNRNPKPNPNLTRFADRASNACAPPGTCCSSMAPLPLSVSGSAVVTSAVYGRRLSEIVWSGWAVMAASVEGDRNCTRVLGLVARYDRAWAGFRAMHLSYTFASSPYFDYYWSDVPGRPHAGIGSTVDAIRRNCTVVAEAFVRAVGL